jgi:hypothetical protein
MQKKSSTKPQQKSRATEIARAILDFTNKQGVPDFITNAVMIAIEGAAIAHNLPRPYMDEKETSETAIPKVAAILKAAGEMFGVSEALEATGRSIATPTKTLAEMIVDVIEHDDCPQEIVDGINESTSGLFNRLNTGDGCVYLTAPYIHALIVEAKLQESQKKGSKR